MNEIRTERLLLRNIIENDAEDIYEYSKSPNVGPRAGWEPHSSIEQTRELMKVIFLNQENVFGIILPETGKLIGSVGLLADPKREYKRALMLGYSLSESYWGMGYMTEAARAVVKHGFESAYAEIISAYSYPFNAASRRVIEKCGFIYEGRLRMAELRYDGELLDNLCFGLTKDEYGKVKNA